VPPDRETLKTVAQQSGGRYFEAPTSGDLRAIYEELGARIAYETRRGDFTAPVTAAAMVLMLTGGALSLVWFGKLP
jgi:Ca-activated chloride channel family protein